MVIRAVIISMSVYVAVDWAVEVEDVDVFVATAVIVDWQAVLVQSVIVKSQIFSHSEAITSTDWVLDQRSFADVLTL